MIVRGHSRPLQAEEFASDAQKLWRAPVPFVFARPLERGIDRDVSLGHFPGSDEALRQRAKMDRVARDTQLARGGIRGQKGKSADRHGQRHPLQHAARDHPLRIVTLLSAKVNAPRAA